MPCRLWVHALLLIDEFMKVELLTILGKQFSKKEPIVEIFLKVADAPRKLDLVVEPVQ
jgi:hypothetical protein